MDIRAPDEPPRCGRFAPSPTGRLHFGSLVAALASRVDALSHGGRWLLRIDDLDRVRCRREWVDDILRSLERFGMHWHGEPAFQSRHENAYAEAFERLRADGQVYFCRCSRRQIRERARSTGPEGPIYPGTCRELDLGEAPGRAARVRVGSASVHFVDRHFGARTVRLSERCGDFVVRRADGFFAYQLAVVIDDALAGVTDVVRGADLLESTPRQIHLQRLLGLPTPRYLHVPLIVDAHGRKLSKRDGDQPVDEQRPVASLLAAWRVLGQTAPDDEPDLDTFWRWAVTAWRPERIPEDPRHVRTPDPL